MNHPENPSAPVHAARGVPARWLLAGVSVVIFAGLILVWGQTDLRQWLDPQALGALGRELHERPFGPLWVLAGYVLGVTLGMPMLVMLTASGLIFGPWLGMAYALTGLVSGATFTYGMGRLIGARLVERAGGPRLATLTSHLRARGFWTVVLLRVFPVAPFLMVNMTAGALRVRLSDYVLGTAVGLLPGSTVLPFLLDRLAAAWHDPGLETYGALLVLLVVTLVGMRWVHRRLRAASRSPQPATAPEPQAAAGPMA